MEIKSSGRPIDTLMEKVLCMNIVSSDYFKELFQLKSFEKVIDEIYNQVDHVEPWMTGNCRGPSTAFCLLYKFFTMKLTVRQMDTLLQHPDSPYIRAVGFLYLRYAADPKTLWGWYEPYIKDDEEFSPGSNGKMTTVGVYVRDLLLGQYYFDTLLPRVPLPILRQITASLEKLKLPTKLSGVTGDSSRLGSDDSTARRPPSVKASLSVSFGQRAPHRASTRDSSPVRKTTLDRERSRDRDRDRERSYDDERDRDRERDRERRERERRERDRETERYRERSSRERRDYGRDRYSRDRARRSRSPRNDRDRYREKESPFNREGSRDNNSKGGVNSNLAKLKDLYGDASAKKEDSSERFRRETGTEEVIRLGGSSSWR